MARKKTNKEKYVNFWDYILNDEKFVAKFLLALSKWFAATMFTLFFILVYYYTETLMPKIIFGVFCGLGWFAVIRFYRMGGTKNFPDMSTSQLFWNKDKVKFYKIGKKK